MDDVLQIVWPEDNEDYEQKEICFQILERLLLLLGSSDLSNGFDFFLVPDPPMSYQEVKLGQWLKEFSTTTSIPHQPAGSLFQWGNKGFGYRTVCSQMFAHLIPKYLNLKGENLTLVVIGNELSELRSQSFQTKVIESILALHGSGSLPHSIRYAGLMFSWGRLVDEFSSLERHEQHQAIKPHKQGVQLG